MFPPVGAGASGCPKPYQEFFFSLRSRRALRLKGYLLNARPGIERKTPCVGTENSLHSPGVAPRSRRCIRGPEARARTGKGFCVPTQGGRRATAKEGE